MRGRKMREPTYMSECCGHFVFLEPINLTQYYIDGDKNWGYVCLKCYKKCKVKEVNNETINTG